MTVTMTVKAPPGTRKKDTVLVLSEGALLTLEQIKALWQVEQTLNALGALRVHIKVEEDVKEGGE